MIGIVKRYVCDACKREECVGETEENTGICNEWLID